MVLIWVGSPYLGPPSPELYGGGRYVCERLGGQTREDGGCLPCRSPLGVGGRAASALNLARVGACADELRLMGIERDELPTNVGRAGGGIGSLSMKASRACEPPATERMWSGPWEDGTNCTTPVTGGLADVP